MPQFDQFSFFNQVFWILLIFINFYFFTSYFLLPKFSKILKLRFKKIKYDKIGNNNLTLERFQFLKKLNSLYHQVFKSLGEGFITKRENYSVSSKISQRQTIQNLPFVNTLYKFNQIISLIVNNKSV